jgi:putative hemolysin
MGDVSTIIGIVSTIVLIGFFAGYEIAFVSANRLGIELKKNKELEVELLFHNF